ncbi:MAG: hypothetical protein WCG27_10300 [Pseudomonadota bacterium]
MNFKTLSFLVISLNCVLVFAQTAEYHADGNRGSDASNGTSHSRSAGQRKRWRPIQVGDGVEIHHVNFNGYVGAELPNGDILVPVPKKK